MRTITVPEFEDFAHDHGAYVRDGGRVLFEDGASCDMEFRQRWQPPIDPLALLEAKRHYVDVKLKQELNNFSQFQESSMSQAVAAIENSNLPGPNSAVQQLKEGQKRIWVLRQKLAVIDEAIEAEPTRQLQRAREADERSRKQQLQILLEAIGALDPDGYVPTVEDTQEPETAYQNDVGELVENI